MSDRAVLWDDPILRESFETMDQWDGFPPPSTLTFWAPYWHSQIISQGTPEET